MRTLFNKLHISNKLAVVFLSLLFLMGVGGVVGLYNARQLVNVTKRLYIDSFKRGETLSVIENEFLSARQEMFLHTIISDTASKSYLEGSIDDHRKKINKLLAEFKSMGLAAGHEDVYNDLLNTLSQYWLVHKEVAQLARSGNRDAALNMLMTEGNRSFTDALNSLKKIIKDEKSAAYTAFKESGFFARVITAVTLAFTLLAIIAAAGLWFALTRAIVHPILAIGESARKIGQGDLKERVPVMTEDEIGNLAIEFNKMAVNIENYYSNLENKVNERTDALRLANEELFAKKQELELANIGLQEANSIKSQFLAKVSHELRTPLNSIIGFSELLREKAFGDLNAKQLQYVEFVHSSGGHLLQLINNILDLSKIEAGRIDLAIEDFPITEVIGEVLGIVRPLARERNVTIESRTVPASPKLRADKAKFKMIMLNLLSNAVKFNVDGGKINVDWQIEEEPTGVSISRSLVFKIRDMGIGIKEEDIGKLFKEFSQIDSSYTREYEGTGLGLILTKRLVELHKGSIWVESEYGKGSTFFIKLPQGTDEIEVPHYTASVFSQDALEKRSPVLIATESNDINHLLEVYLAGGHYAVTMATDGVDLLRKASEQKPFVIIMGVTLPKKDGWEVLNELKASPDTADIPVVIISSIDNRDLCGDFGVVDYLEEPIKREQLLEVLGRIGA